MSLNDRPIGLRQLLRRLTQPVRELMEERLPEGVGFFQTTGSLCLLMAAVQVVTGVLMAFYYTPSPDVAWESIRYVDEQVSFGRIIHGLHHWGSSGFVVAVFIHLLRVFTFGAYKGERRWTWLVGVGLLIVVLGFGFTGYLLPWDMKAYFGTKVGTSISAYVPLVGPFIRRFLLGGDEIGELTLPRFYALHVLVLPLALLALVSLHLLLVRLYGITPPWKRVGEEKAEGEPFFPGQALRDSCVAAAALIILLALAWKFGGNLGDKVDPTTTTFAPHPEWYFLGLQQLLRYFQGPWQIIGTVVIPAGVILLLLLLPFLDRNPERNLRRRPIAATLGLLGLLVAVGLTIEGYRQLRHERIELAALAEEINAREAEAARLEEVARTAEAEPPDPAAASMDFVDDPGIASFGQTLYETLKCALCHVGPGVGEDANLPPSLEYAGNRFQPGWMMAYLENVPPRRYDSRGRRTMMRMPDYHFKPNELRGMTAYMKTLQRPELFEFEGVTFEEPTAEEIAAGQRHFEGESCHQCHKLNGAGSSSAPDLDNVGSRLTPVFIYAIILDAQALIPGTTMDESFLNEQEIYELTQYLVSLKEPLTAP
jgi:ubiquinol-cytochrome c reductase cytochrome b subunit